MPYGPGIVGFISASGKQSRPMIKSWTGFAQRLLISKRVLLGPNRPNAAVMLPPLCIFVVTKMILIILLLTAV
jgi:hypothetical protein